MNFKKFLIRRNETKAQATIEYLVLAALILGMMLLSLNTFFPNLKKNLDENFFQRCVERISR